MRILPAATAMLLAIALAGCSSPASGAGSSPRAAQAKTILARDVSLMSLESAMAKLDAVGVSYEARIQGPEGTILKDPKAAAEKGKWKALMLVDDTKGAFSKEELKTGDFVQILVSPMVEPTPTPTPTAKAPATHTVTYHVTADGPILNTTFGNTIGGNMSTEQANNVASPFAKEYVFTASQLDGGFNVFSVYAQAGEGATTITCQIERDGQMGTPHTSTGPYAVVTCSS